LLGGQRRRQRIGRLHGIQNLHGLGGGIGPTAAAVNTLILYRYGQSEVCDDVVGGGCRLGGGWIAGRRRHRGYGLGQKGCELDQPDVRELIDRLAIRGAIPVRLGIVLSHLIAVVDEVVVGEVAS